MTREEAEVIPPHGEHDLVDPCDHEHKLGPVVWHCTCVGTPLALYSGWWDGPRKAIVVGMDADGTIRTQLMPE
jgi:hypothetical protein